VPLVVGSVLFSKVTEHAHSLGMSSTFKGPERGRGSERSCDVNRVWLAWLLASVLAREPRKLKNLRQF
jgi:hypothetical protein